MKTALRAARPFIHFMCISIGMTLGLLIRKRTDLIPFLQLPIPPIDIGETIFFIILSGIIYVAIGFTQGLYALHKPIHGYTNTSLLTNVYRFIGLSFLGFYGGGLLFPSSISRLFLIQGTIVSIFLLIFIDLIINAINSRLEKKYPYRVCAIYENEQFYEYVLHNVLFYQIYKLDGFTINGITNLKQLIQDYDIIVLIGSFKIQTIQYVTDIVRNYDKLHYHITESAFLEDIIYTPARFGPIMGYAYKASPLEGRGRVTKRLFDISLSFGALIIFSPIYLCISIFILRADGRPIFYTSTRVGKGGKLIKIYKFRSMVKNAEETITKLKKLNERKGPLFKIKNDPRIIFGGKTLRKFSLDELPQFLNILAGTMSIVGPRPHLAEEVAQYTIRQQRLLSVKPGITGYAQIFGRDKLSFDEEAKLDLFYIQNRNLFLDIYVIILTTKVIHKGS